MIGRAGVTHDMFTVGEKIRVAGNRSDHYDNKFWVENVLTSDGREILVVATGEPCFTDEIVGIRNKWTNESFIQNSPPAAGDGIFRVWSPATRDYETRLTGDPENSLSNITTDAAREDGDDILLLAEEFYLTRKIHMGSDIDPESVPHSPLGTRWGAGQMKIRCSSKRRASIFHT
jgi:hypothetical protein